MGSKNTTKTINIKQMLAHTVAKPPKGGLADGYIRIYGDGLRIKMCNSYATGSAYAIAYSTQGGGALIITPDSTSKNHINKRHQLSVPAHVAKEIAAHTGTHKVSVVKDGKTEHTVVVF